MNLDKYRIPPTYLYHGSNLKLKKLIPKNSGIMGSYVFATSSYDFALAYAGNDWNDYDINQTMVDGIMYLTEIRENMFNEKFNCSGYIYYIKPDNFQCIEDIEYISKYATKIIKVDIISNILEALKSSKTIKLYMYPNLPYFIQSRKSYIDELNKKY